MFPQAPTMSTKRKASLHSQETLRKHRRLGDDGSRSSSSSDSNSDAQNLAETWKDPEDDDSDDDTPIPISIEPLPERIRVSKKTIIAPSVLKEAPLPQATAVPDFTDLGISTTLLRSLKTMSIRKPTPVQAACIPSLLSGQCVLPR